MILDKETVLELLGNWEYPFSKRVTRNEVQKGWSVRNATLPEQFGGTIKIVGLYACVRRCWYMKDKFELVSLDVKVHGKTIATFVSPDKPIPKLGKSSVPLHSRHVKDKYVPLSEIFSRLVVKED